MTGELSRHKRKGTSLPQSSMSKGIEGNRNRYWRFHKRSGSVSRTTSLWRQERLPTVHIKPNIETSLLGPLTSYNDHPLLTPSLKLPSTTNACKASPLSLLTLELLRHIYENHELPSRSVYGNSNWRDYVKSKSKKQGVPAADIRQKGNLK